MMKKNLLAGICAAALLAVSSIGASADWYDGGYDDYYYDDYGYDYNNYDYGYDTYDYGYDDTYDYGYDYNEYGYDDGTGTVDTEGTSSADSSSVLDPLINSPANVTLELSPIEDTKFKADLKIDYVHKITAADFTITYDTNVLKLNSSSVSKKAEGTIAAAETTPGEVQFQYTNEQGSEFKDSYLTMNFEIIAPTERSSVIYIKVNSLLDENRTQLTYRADGSIVQIAGAVTYDASADESMYKELKIYQSDTPITFSQLGIGDVVKASIKDETLAKCDKSAITTLRTGLANMVVEFSDGTRGYYRLVVADPATTTTAAASTEIVPVTDSGVIAADQNSAAQISSSAPDTSTSQLDSGITRTETKSNSNIKNLIIFILVILAIIAVIVEFFIFYGNPYAETFALLKQRRAEKAAEQADFSDDENDYEQESDEPEEISDEQDDQDDPADSDPTDTE